jgi:hypothetical protein
MLSQLRVRIKTLSASGHDEAELEAIQEDFNRLMNRGYALFVKEQQVSTLAEAAAAWGALEGTETAVELVAVPALAGGAH